MSTILARRTIDLVLMMALAGLLGSVPAVADDSDLERGIAAFEAGDYDRAYELLKPEAEAGDADARYYVGRMYSFGHGVEQDLERGIRTSYRAAQQGQPQAQRTIGYSYLKGAGVREDHEEAARWYRKAAEAGDPPAQRSMGLRYKRGEGVERDYQQAAEWFRRAAGQDDAWAAYELGEIYYYGRGPFELDYDQAHHWFGEAARAGNARAQYALGGLYLQGLGVDSDNEVAYVWTLMAAEQGHKAAQQAWDNAGWYLDEEQKKRVREQVEEGVVPAID